MKTILTTVMICLLVSGCLPSSTAVPTGTNGSPIPDVIPETTPTVRRNERKAATITTTAVPSGVLALIFFSPFIANYQPSIWEDESEYGNPNYYQNRLRATQLGNCSLNVALPSGFYPEIDAIVCYGENCYQKAILIDETSDTISTFLLFDHSKSGNLATVYGYPLFMVTADNDEWEACQRLAEDVLATLHIP